MEITTTNEILIYISIGLAAMFIIIGVVIAIAVLAHKRHLTQQNKMHEMQAAHQKDLFSSMVKAQEIERQKISKNLHDEIGTTLSAGKLLISQIQRKTDGNVHDMVLKVREILDSTISETRRVIDDLSPDSLKKFGLFAELNKLSILSEEVGGLMVNIEADDTKERFSPEIELTLYRIIKEFINNSLKYAQAVVIDIVFEKVDNNLIICLKDDGVGFDFNPNDSKGYGIKNMESRVFLLNGKSEYKSKIGVGTQLKIEIPLPKQ